LPLEATYKVAESKIVSPRGRRVKRSTSSTLRLTCLTHRGSSNLRAIKTAMDKAAKQITIAVDDLKNMEGPM
jgi:hypothetical protein